MKTQQRTQRERVDDLTRAERRQLRREAERQRMPLHGRGMGVMVGNAILRRAKEKDGRRSGSRKEPGRDCGRRPR